MWKIENVAGVRSQYGRSDQEGKGVCGWRKLKAEDDRICENELERVMMMNRRAEGD